MNRPVRFKSSFDKNRPFLYRRTSTEILTQDLEDIVRCPPRRGEPATSPIKADEGGEGGEGQQQQQQREGEGEYECEYELVGQVYEQSQSQRQSQSQAKDKDKDNTNEPSRPRPKPKARRKQKTPPKPQTFKPCCESTTTRVKQQTD